VATDTERASWRKAFDMVGPATMRLRLEHRRNEFAPDYAREAELWLLEQDAEVLSVETRRFNTIRFWTIVAAVAGIIAAIGSIIAAWPVLKGSS
jgi:hypothetical protein